MLRTLSIRKRLLLLMAMGLMAGVGVGAASLSLAQRERIAFAGGAASQERSHSIALHLANQTREWKEILLGGSDAVSFARHRDAFFAEERLVREEADALARSDASVQPLVADLLAAHEALGEQYRATLREFADGGGASTLASGRSTAQIDEATSALVERVMAACDARTDRVAQVDLAGWLLAVGLTGGLLGLIYLVLGLAITRSLIAPAAQLERGITALAHGELDVHIEDRSKDEFGRMTRRLNEALATMRDLLSEVANAANSVAHTSEELSSASGSISSGAQEQAAGLAETATSLERITGTVKLNAEHAHEAARLAESAHDVAEQGGRVVGDAVTAMGEINQSSKQIADIITTIDEIAFQTNLLALNAAVEAARAGEQGRGFAVVASEVRNLAQRSAASAKEIKALIQDSVTKVESGAELVNTSGRTLSEIVDSVKRVTDIVAEIAVASREQSAGIDQVNRSVAQMDTVTQSNASQTEELSATAETLSAKGRQLQALVARFKLDEVDAPAVEQTIPQPRSGKSTRQAAARRAKRPRLVVAAGR